MLDPGILRGQQCEDQIDRLLVDRLEFQRTLEAYEKTLGQGTTVVLPLDTEFFKYLGTSKQ